MNSCNCIDTELTYTIAITTGIGQIMSKKNLLKQQYEMKIMMLEAKNIPYHPRTHCWTYPKCVPSIDTVSPSGKTRTYSQFTSLSLKDGQP